ncbi:MAG: hypothetical protein FWH12_01660 [Treponema sp.]|nr:hypothetical protein [Treponema sp.]
MNLDNSILNLGLCLVRIRDEKLYLRLGLPHMSAYVMALAEETKKNRSSIYKWLAIGEIFLKYEEKLRSIGFGPLNSPSKLPYLERALARGPEDLVYSYLMEMNQRDFAHYAKTGKTKGPAVLDQKMDELLPEPSSLMKEVSGKEEFTIYYQETWAVKVNKALTKNVIKWIRMAIQLAFNALDRKGSVTAVHLDSIRELIRFNVIAAEAREKMQAEMRRGKKKPLSN